MLSEGNCDWERTPAGVRCKREGCGNRLRVAADYPLDRIHATCLALDPELKKLRASREKPVRDTMRNPCRYLGPKTGEQAECRGCGGKPTLFDLFACDIFATCLPTALADGFHCCRICKEYEPIGGLTQ